MAGAKLSRRVLARVIAQKLIAEPARHEHWIQLLAAYLVAHKRQAEAGLVINDIERELYEQDGQLLATITSARPLDNTVRAHLTKLLTEHTGARSVTLTESVDPALLGGLVARTPDAELDVSVRTKLNRLATIN